MKGGSSGGRKIVDAAAYLPVLPCNAPLRLLLHVVLLLTGSLQVCWLNIVESKYLRAVNRTWRFFFFPPDYDLGSGELTYDRIYTADSLVRIIDDSVATYYDLPLRATTELKLAGSQPGHCLTLNESITQQRFVKAKQPELSVTRYGDPETSSLKTTTTYQLSLGTSVTETLGIGEPRSPVVATPGTPPRRARQIGESGAEMRSRAGASMGTILDSNDAGARWVWPETPGIARSLWLENSTALPIEALQETSSSSELLDPVEYFSTVSHIIFSFDVCNRIDRGPTVDDCYHWTVKVHYDMADGTGALLRLVNILDKPKCQHKALTFSQYLNSWEGLLELAMALLAATYAILLFRTLRRARRDYFHARRLHGRVRRRAQKFAVDDEGLTRLERPGDVEPQGVHEPPLRTSSDTGRPSPATATSDSSAALSSPPRAGNDAAPRALPEKRESERAGPSSSASTGSRWTDDDTESLSDSENSSGSTRDEESDDEAVDYWTRVSTAASIDTLNLHDTEMPFEEGGARGCSVLVNGPTLLNHGNRTGDQAGERDAEGRRGGGGATDPTPREGMKLTRPLRLQTTPRATTPAVAGYRWSSIPWRVRMRFFSPWLIGSLLAALAMTASNLFALWTRELHTRTSIGDKLLSGLTLLLLWVTFMSHLRAVPSLFQVIHTVGAAYLFFLAFMCGVLPLFVGFAIMGYDAFGFDVANFGSFDQTCKTLFSVLNGDSIFDIYMQLERRFPPLGNGYLTLFIMLFIYVVLNTLRAIVEESFFASRSFRRSLQPFLRRTLEERALADMGGNGKKGRDTGAVAGATKAEPDSGAASITAAEGGGNDDTDGTVVKASMPKMRSLRASQAPEAGASFWGKDYEEFEKVIGELGALSISLSSRIG